MAVTASLSGNTATVTVTVDCTDLIAATASSLYKNVTLLQRVYDQLGTLQQAVQNTNNQLDAQLAAHQAANNVIKAARIPPVL